MKIKKAILFFVILLILFANTACWDRIEVNKRSYVMGIGVDEYDPQKADIEIKNQKDDPMYNVIFELSALKKQEGGDGNFKVTVSASNISQAINALETTVEHPAVLTHLQAIVISEKVARNGIIQIVDYLLRNSDVRRRTKVFICQGKASDIFKYKPQISKTVGEYLNEIPVNANNSPLVLVESDLGTVSFSLATQIDFMLPKIYCSGKNVTTKGGAVLSSEGKFVGWAENKVFEGAKWIRGLYKRGSIPCDCPITKKTVIVNINKSRTKIKIDKDNSVLVKIHVKGNMDTNLGGKTHLTDEYIRKINRNTEASIKDRVEKAIDYFQRDIESDALFLKLKFKHYKHNTFEKYKDNWNKQFFKDMIINVEVRADIENVGTITTLQ